MVIFLADAVLADRMIVGGEVSLKCARLIDYCASHQGGITCEAIYEPRKSSKAIDKRVIINFRNKNVVMARFCDKNEVFVLFID